MSFQPFDDSRNLNRGIKPTKSGLSYPFDGFRQGVEINTQNQLFLGTQPKLWAGQNNNVGLSSSRGIIDNSTQIVTYGQAASYIDYSGNSIFKELPKFDPISYITLGTNYPLPISLNNGPPGQAECQIEPLTIPFVLPTTEGPYYVHAIHATLEDGNSFFTTVKSSDKIKQFVQIGQIVSCSYFLDSGGNQMGSIVIPSYASGTVGRLEPFDDNCLYTSIKTLTGVKKNDTTLEITLENMLLNSIYYNIEDMRPLNYNSSNSGFTYQGSTCGTDSIAFGGQLVGNDKR